MAKTALSTVTTGVLGVIPNVAHWEALCVPFTDKCRCHHGEAPEMHHEPGCTFIRCKRDWDCQCKMSDGGDMTPFALRTKWRNKYEAVGG